MFKIQPTVKITVENEGTNGFKKTI